MTRRRTRILPLGIVAVAFAIVILACSIDVARPVDNSQAPTPAPTQTSPITQVDEPPVVVQGPEDIAAYCPVLINSSDPYFGTQQRARLADEIENPSFQSHSWFVSIRQELARDYLRFGEADEAIALLTEALDAEERVDSELSHLGELLESLAIANLKLGELSNCLSPDGRLICTLPLDDSYVQENTRGSTNAIKYFERLLELEPDNIRARWLLNIAHMTLGTYPQQVPDQFLIPRDLLASDYDIGRFDEIAPYAGLYAVAPAGGSIIEDFDNDGLLDIMTSTWDPCKPVTYYHNNGDGRFVDYTERAGLLGQLGGLNIVQADYNNDGWKDVLVMRGGWMRMRGRMRMSLLRNNGDNTFTDVSQEAGIAYPAYPSQSAVWADYDNDGLLDLFSCNESMLESASELSAMVFPSQLFHNNGDGTFTDVAHNAGVTNFRFCKGSAWGDYDNDGDPDLYVSNFSEENRLYRNNGDGTFTDVALDMGVAEPVDSFATWFWDYDNDGWLDLFVAGYGLDIGDVAADYLKLPNDGARMKLYRNDGAGGFIDVTRDVGLHKVHLTMGANFGDLDNDGFPDFYLGTGYPSYDALGPNIMYRNNEGKDFVDVTFSGGFGHLQKGHGVSFGDLDNDGDQDIFAQIGGFFPGDAFANALYKNPGNGNRWLSVKLEGVQSNRAGIGARIKINLAMDDGTERSVFSLVTSGGSFGASPLQKEIGLGQAKRIESIEIDWPASGIHQTISNVPLDSHIEVREGESTYRLLERQPTQLGILR